MTALYRLGQWVWGLPQTLAGLCVFLFTKGEHTCYHGAVVKRWKNRGSASLGMFIFLSDSLSEQREKRVLVHEYGHTIQSLILGPLYLIAVGLPSALWAGLPQLRRLRGKREIPYYGVYPENWANALGERATGEQADR